jgi:hypothetical protein
MRMAVAQVDIDPLAREHTAIHIVLFDVHRDQNLLTLQFCLNVTDSITSFGKCSGPLFPNTILDF